MDTFLQQVINGLTAGSVYAVVALGYTMVYGIIQLINFAHGEVVMIGAMVAFTVINALLLYLVGVILKPHFTVDTFWSAFLGALNRLQARRLHLPVLDQRQRLFPVDFRPNAVFSPRNKPLQPSPIGFASLLPVNPPVAQSNFESIAIGKRLQR